MMACLGVALFLSVCGESLVSSPPFPRLSSFLPDSTARAPLSALIHSLACHLFMFCR